MRNKLLLGLAMGFLATTSIAMAAGAGAPAGAPVIDMLADDDDAGVGTGGSSKQPQVQKIPALATPEGSDEDEDEGDGDGDGSDAGSEGGGFVDMLADENDGPSEDKLRADDLQAQLDALRASSTQREQQLRSQITTAEQELRNRPTALAYAKLEQDLQSSRAKARQEVGEARAAAQDAEQLREQKAGLERDLVNKEQAIGGLVQFYENNILKNPQMTGPLSATNKMAKSLGEIVRVGIIHYLHEGLRVTNNELPITLTPFPGSKLNTQDALNNFFPAQKQGRRKSVHFVGSAEPTGEESTGVAGGKPTVVKKTGAKKKTGAASTKRVHAAEEGVGSRGDRSRQAFEASQQDIWDGGEEEFDVDQKASRGTQKTTKTATGGGKLTGKPAAGGKSVKRNDDV